MRFPVLPTASQGLGGLVRLVLVGDGPERLRCQSALRDRGIDDLAWLPGRSDDIPGIMRALDAFVLPSLNEGISNTILEAMATSLPIVATAVGGNPELIEHGVHGLLVPSGDVEAMAQAMTRCSSTNRAMRRRLARRPGNGWNRSSRSMRWRHNTVRFYQYLQGPDQTGQKLRAA